MRVINGSTATGGVRGDPREDRAAVAERDLRQGLPADRRHDDDALAFLTSFGTVRVVGIDGTSSCGAGLARAVRAARFQVVN